MIAIKFTVIFISFALAASRAFRGSNFKSAGDCLEKVNATFVELTPEGFYQRVTVIIERLTDPSIAPTEPPTQIPSMPPTDAPTLAPTVSPTTEPTAEPTVQPTQTPSVVPTVIPTVSPSILPTVLPTTIPTVRPSVVPTIVPTITPTSAPTMAPTVIPSESPSTVPTIVPTTTPSVSPSVGPSRGPTQTPTINPTRQPSVLPTTAPTLSPTVVPSVTPTAIPSTAAPSQLPYLVKDALSAVSNPGDMAFDDQNCLYVADGSYILRYNTSSGLTVIAAGAPVEYIPLSSTEDVAATSVGLYGQRLTIRGTDMYTTGLRSILKVNLLSGMIRGFAGRPVGESCGDGNGDGGSATAACFDNTSDLFADSVGGLYVLTKSAINHFIRYIDPTGIVSTYAGTMAASMNEAGVAATSAMISVDRMTGDTLGSLFYTSTTVKMIDASRIIRDFAGATSGAGILPTYSNGVAASEASLDATYFAINPINGDLYYESYCNIYKVSASTNKVTQLAGLTCSEGDVSLYLSGRSAFNTALGAVGTMAIDMNGKFLYFFGFNGIRVVSIEVPYTSPPTSLPTTRQPSVAPTTAAPTHLAYQVQNVVGTGTGGSGCSALKVTGSIATSTGIFFNNNEQLTFDGNDNLYVSNYGCQVILKVNSGIVSVAAGGGSVVPTANNEIAATSADLTRMWSGLAARGNDVFVQNFQNNYVTRMDATTGNFKIVFGTGSATNTGDGLPASSASIVRPFNIVADTVGALYVGSQGCTSCGQGGWVIRKINAAGIVSTVAGIVSAEAGPTTSNLAGVAATSVTITANGLAVDTVGNIFLTASKKVSIIGSDGIMRDFVGGGTVNPDTVGPVPATSANLNTFIVDVNPQNGDLFLSNLVTSNINKVARSTMIVTKFAGQGYQENHGDGGPASSAVLRVPVGMAFDSSREKLYWVEQFNVRSAYLN